MEDLQKILTGMSKPEVPPLKHQEALSRLVIQGKRRMAVSVWWLAVPVFMVAAFVMKEFYKPGSTLGSSIRDFKERNFLLSFLLFVFVPLVVAGIQVRQICQPDPGRPFRWAGRLRAGWLYGLFLIISLVIIILYLCN